MILFNEKKQIKILSWVFLKYCIYLGIARSCVEGGVAAISHINIVFNYHNYSID